MEKDDKIKQEFEKYLDIFTDIAEDRKPFVEKQCQQLAFMSNTLQELQDKVKKEGAVIESTNGNGFTTYNEHPAQKSYNTMIKNYNATIKALIDLLPKEQKDNDELLEFISGYK